MAHLLPPPPPAMLAFMDDGNLYRVHFRLWQIWLTWVTVLLTGWFCTLGVVPAILALMVGKHVVVAIVAAGLHLKITHPADTSAGECDDR